VKCYYSSENFIWEKNIFSSKIYKRNVLTVEMHSLKTQMTLGHWLPFINDFEVLSWFSNLDSCDKRSSASLGESQDPLPLIGWEHNYQ